MPSCMFRSFTRLQCPCRFRWTKETEGLLESVSGIHGEHLRDRAKAASPQSRPLIWCSCNYFDTPTESRLVVWRSASAPIEKTRRAYASGGSFRLAVWDWLEAVHSRGLSESTRQHFERCEI